MDGVARQQGQRYAMGTERPWDDECAALATAVMAFPLMARAIRLPLEGVGPELQAAARTLGAGPVDRFLTVTLPLMVPGILAGAVIAFAAGLGEFGAVITFASSIPGQTQTLPPATRAAIQAPGGEAAAAKLSLVSFTLAVAGLLLPEVIARRVRGLLGL